MEIIALICWTAITGLREKRLDSSGLPTRPAVDAVKGPQVPLKERFWRKQSPQAAKPPWVRQCPLSNLSSACVLTKLGSDVRRTDEPTQSAVETNTSAASRRNTAGGKWPALGLSARGWSNACWPAGKEPWERYSEIGRASCRERV